MRALSIKQPWAWLILHAGKDVENRTWPAPRGFTMPQRIAVHASKQEHRNAPWRQIRDLISDEAIRNDFLGVWQMCSYPFGAIVGTVCVTAWTDGWAAGSPWYEGEYGLILSDPIALPEPIPCKGRLGLWDVPPEIEAQLQEQIKDV